MRPRLTLSAYVLGLSLLFPLFAHADEIAAGITITSPVSHAIGEILRWDWSGGVPPYAAKVFLDDQMMDKATGIVPATYNWIGCGSVPQQVKLLLVDRNGSKLNSSIVLLTPPSEENLKNVTQICKDYEPITFRTKPTNSANSLHSTKKPSMTEEYANESNTATETTAADLEEPTLAANQSTTVTTSGNFSSAEPASLSDFMSNTLTSPSLANFASPTESSIPSISAAPMNHPVSPSAAGQEGSTTMQGISSTTWIIVAVVAVILVLLAIGAGFLIHSRDKARRGNSEQTQAAGRSKGNYKKADSESSDEEKSN